MNCVPEIEYVDPGVSVLGTEVMVGCQAELKVPAEVRNSTSVVKSVYIICPFGRTSRCPTKEGSVEAFGGLAIPVKVVPSHS